MLRPVVSLPPYLHCTQGSHDPGKDRDANGVKKASRGAGDSSRDPRIGVLLDAWLGYPTFTALREKTEVSLDGRIDLSELHNVVLRDWASSPPVLEDVVNAYTEEAAAN